MNNQELLGQIVKEFNESAKNAATLSESLESFNKILANLNEKISLVNEVKDFLQEDNPIETLSSVLDKIEQDNILETIKDSFQKVDNIYLSIEKDSEKINSYIKSIDDVGGSVQNAIDRYLTLSEQIIELNQAILQAMSALENLEIKRVSDKILNAIQSFDISLKKSNDSMKEIIDTNIALRKTFDKLNQDNKEPMEHFMMLCDIWAKERLKKFAIKKPSFWKKIFRK